MKILCMTVAVIFILAAFSGCEQLFTEAQAEPAQPIMSYRDIPGLTPAETEAISELRKNYDMLSIGMPLSTEAYIGTDGKIGGYSVYFAQWLTQLFEIPFDVINLEWNETLNALENGTIHFNGSMIPTEERKDIFLQTAAIAQRSVVYFRLSGSRPVMEQIRDPMREHPVKIGMLENTATADVVLTLLIPGTFQPVFISENADVYEYLSDGTIDAYAYSNTLEIIFDAHPDIVTEDFYPITFTPVSLTAQNPDFGVMISLVSRALGHDATRLHLSQLYNRGYDGYLKNKFLSQLTNEEHSYISGNPVIMIAMQADNYPLSFYDRYIEQWQGIAFDILNEVSALTGMSFEMANSTLPTVAELMSMLESGEARLHSGLIQTPEREGKFLWPRNHNMSSNYALISKTDFRDIRINEILSVRVGLLSNSAHTEMFRLWFPFHTNNREYETRNELIDALDSGDVDLVMQSDNWLLYLTNFRERPDFKANVVFNSPYISSFGFGIDEAVLCSIVDKALGVIDQAEIERRWISKTYDYRATVTEAQAQAAVAQWQLLFGVTVMLVLFVTLMTVLFVLNRNKNKRGMVMLNSTPLACRLSSKKLKLFDCNEETVRLFQMKDKQDYLDNIDDVIPEFQPDGRESRVIRSEAVEKALAHGKYVFEFMHVLRDGTPLPCEVTIVRVKYGRDDILATYTRDLREQKKLIYEIEEANKRIGTVRTEEFITKFSVPFTQPYDFNELLNHALFELRDFTGTDRAVIWELQPDGVLICTFENVISEETPKIIGRSLKFEDRSSIIEEAERTGCCYVKDAASYYERNPQTNTGGKSFCYIPIMVEGERAGYLAFYAINEQANWAEGEFHLATMAGAIIAGAYSNRKNDALKQETLQAQQANETKSMFLSNMSHEMRTPLNAIIGLSGLTLESGRLDEEANFNIEKVNSAGLTLLSIVNDILDISKIEAGKLELVAIEYDMPSLLNDTVNQSIMHIGEKPVQFILNIDESLPAKLFGDELRIKQIFNNFMSNAFKYTLEGFVELGISCERDADTVWMTAYIKDTGIGIKPENMGKLFEDYAQLDMKANRRVMGIGLGLPLTKKLVDLLGGTIAVESEYGKGSTFTVRFPQTFVSDEIIGTEIVNNLKSSRYTDHKRKENSKLERIKLPYAHVLVVDDFVTNLDVAKGLMKPYGMQIDLVTSGQQAIDAIRSEKVRYNAVFMDHMMPEMDGVEATRIIRTEIGTEYAENIPIIALTANAITGNEEMFLNKGFSAFISKPIEIARLDSVIRKWVRDENLEASEAELEEETESAPSKILPFHSFHIDGVDLYRGLERFGGDEESYLQVLRSYAANTRLLLEKIKSVNPDNPDNLNDYAIIVHGIKGSSYGICANTAAEKAEALEKSSKAGDIGFINDNNIEFITVLEKLLTDLDNMLNELKSHDSKLSKASPDKEVLNRISAACKNYDMDMAEAAIRELEMYNYETGGELVAWLWENVQQFNIEEIIEKLSGTLSTNSTTLR